MNTDMSKNIFRIVTPSLLKNKKWLFLMLGILVFFSIFLNIFLHTKQQETEPLEKDNTTLFLENLMIRDGGIYTLLGSKPLTEFDITFTTYETEEEIKNSYENEQAFLEKYRLDPVRYKSNEIVLPEYEEYKKKILQNSHSQRFLKRDKIWEEWLHEKGIISNPVYKLTFKGKGDRAGLFVNIPQAIYILTKYYHEFATITCLQFDVNTILNSIDDEESKFWEIVFKNHYLHGLLLGYGEKNSYLFDWARNNSISLDDVSIIRFPELKRLHQIITHKKANITIQDLQIPYFVSFEISDLEVERYLREKEKIIDFLKNKDFISFVLNHLK